MPISKTIVYNPRRYTSTEIFVSAPKDQKLKAMVQHNMIGVLTQLNGIVVTCTDLFGTLLSESKATHERIKSLSNRVRDLKSGVSSIENKLVSSLRDPSSTFSIPSFEYRTTAVEDSMLLLRRSCPEVLKNIYAQCRPPPQMSKMNPYMDNPGDDCLKNYTNPMFFIEEWIRGQQKMRQDMKEKRKKKKEDKQQKGDKGQTEGAKEKRPKSLQKKQFAAMGAEFQSTTNLQAKQQSGGAPQQSRQQMSLLQPDLPGPPPPSSNSNSNSDLGLPPPPPMSGGGGGGGGGGGAPLKKSPSVPKLPIGVPPPTDLPGPPPPMSGMNDMFDVPPPPDISFAPPPPPPMLFDDFAPPPPPSPMQQQQQQSSSSSSNAPPPPAMMPPAPAPPPPPPGLGPSPMANGRSLLASIEGGTTLKKAEERPTQPKIVDTRSSLLNAIHNGQQLKSSKERVLAEKKQTEKEIEVGNNIAAILNRTMAIRTAVADSDSEDEDDGDWDD